MTGVGGSREREAFCLDYFSFFFPLNKRVKTHVLTCIWHKKTGFKCQEYSKLSSFNSGTVSAEYYKSFIIVCGFGIWWIHLFIFYTCLDRDVSL